ncbi:uncharacterized protein FOMMEDRAFT_110963 [Fomitiporia mediterranea MF3/22]|uniref:uncharacterized protein n=1 Tax=Fomitiporia mediterranea (strain MF3/22) TaxID=694068 RepID=UPI0004408193|nr:uncharacterized protein FOMMEDRAFT_110963 [Fomitiporia mediterranea MF3/22]EJD01274.1 hypothetical protein FOMMEDRAFT_110963 [Fomitiporia mediterranea MF3/22]
MKESDNESDNDAFSQLRILDRLAPSAPPGLINHITQLEFPSNRTLCRDDSFADKSQQLRDVLRVSLRVDASPGCGGIAWPAGEVLSRYIARRPRSSLLGKNVIELGSGTGLVGLVAASSGASRVWITDQAPMLDIMRENVTLNGLGDTTHVVEYNWGFPKPDALPSRADLILAADCVYFEPAFPLLVATLCDLVPVCGSCTEVLFCYKKRRKADKRFFTLLKKHFEWKQVDDDPDFSIYSRDAISLLSLTRKR